MGNGKVLVFVGILMLIFNNVSWAQEDPDQTGFLKVGGVYISADVPTNRGGQNLGDNQWNWDLGFNMGFDGILFGFSMLPDGFHGDDGGMPVFNLDISRFATRNLRFGLGVSIVQIYEDIEDESRIKRDRVVNPYIVVNYAFLRNFYLDYKVGIGNRSFYSGFGVCLLGKCSR